MKNFYSFITLLSLAMVVTARAALVTGVIQCDANQNGTNDIGDTGIAGVRVVVVNQNGSFSNSTFSTANGSFSLPIPNFDPLAERQDPLSQVYVETLDPATLPAGSVIVFPQAITNLSLTPAFYIDFFGPELTNLTYTSASGNSTNGNWLINSPDCQSSACGVTGSGIIRGASRRPEHSFSGNISLKTLRNGTRRGNWTDVAHTANLLFKSTAIQTVSCFESPTNTIEFSGSGKLKGTGLNKTRFIPVLFTVRVEDHGRKGRGVDRYYLRVYSSDGTTLLLVSGDPSDPLNIVTVPISAGNLTVTHPKTR